MTIWLLSKPQRTVVLILAFLKCSVIALSQCCSCLNYGAELVYNGNFSSGNVGFTTSYFFKNSGASYPGSYGITTNASTGNGYWGACHDHSSGNGNLMWIDLASSNTNVWTQSITSIIPNTNYLFSSWACNLLANYPGTLQFSINNQLLGTPLTVPSNSCSWVKFCVLWNSGNNTSANITITNQSLFPWGNDVAIDDISFRQCMNETIINASICPGQYYFFSIADSSNIPGIYYDTTQSNLGCQSITITHLSQNPSYTQNVSDKICFNESYQLPCGNNTSSPGVYHCVLPSSLNCDSTIITTLSLNPQINGAYTTTNASCYSSRDAKLQLSASGGTQPYSFQVIGYPANSNGYFDSLSSGNFNYIITDSESCSVNGTAFINQPSPLIQSIAPIDTLIEVNSIANLSTSFNYPNSLAVWAPSSFLSCNPCPNPTANPDNDISYKLTVSTYINGKTCFQDTTLTIHIKPNFYIPNCFTPDNNGLNDCFQIFGNNLQNMQNFDIQIYNRWGQRIYLSNNVYFKWCDANIPDGMYAYIIKFKVAQTEKNLKGVISKLSNAQNK